MRPWTRAVCLTFVLGISGCAASAPPPPPPVVVSDVPPPPPAQTEVLVARPSPAHVWVAGYWAWRPARRAYVWVPGRWVVPSSPRHVWIPGHWVRYAGGYVWVEGHWRH